MYVMFPSFKLFKLAAICAIILFPFTKDAEAIDLTSSNFIIRDPIVGTGSGFGTSTNFQLLSSGNTLLSGYGTSATYIGKYGFLYYPYATDPVLTATPGVSNVDLDWTASVAGQGWSVSGYKTGKASVSGGPYTYTSVGNVLTYDYTGLVPGDYCFVVETLDAFNNTIATSNEECETIYPGITFAISSGTIEFGALSPALTKYATTSGGSTSNSVAHTISASSNSVSGYSLTYNGPSLSNGEDTLTAATITGDADGTPGSSEFALSLSTDGGATIPTAYAQSSLNWKFVPNVTSEIASTTGITGAETFSSRYISNISSALTPGAYSTNITYILTGNF